MSPEIPPVAAAASAMLSGAQLTMRLLRQHGLETIFALSGNGVLYAVGYLTVLMVVAALLFNEREV